jgi:hypothetical protein
VVRGKPNEFDQRLAQTGDPDATAEDAEPDETGANSE